MRVFWRFFHVWRAGGNLEIAVVFAAYMAVFLFFQREVFLYAKKFSILDFEAAWLKSLFIFFPLFLITALRSVDVGIDTARYSEEYERAKSLEPVIRSTEFIFSYLLIAFSKLGVSFQGFLFFQSYIYYLAISSLLVLIPNRSYFTYFLVVVCFGLFSFGLSGIRQSIAISLFLFSVFPLLRGRHSIYAVLGLIAFFVHNSSIIVFLVTFFVSNVFLGFRVFYFGVLLSPLTVLVNETILYAFSFFDIKQLSNFNNDTDLLLNIKVPMSVWSFVLVMGFVMRYGKNVAIIEAMKSHDNYLYVRSLCMWGCVFLCALLWMASSIRLMDRLGLYFVPFVALFSAWILASVRETLVGWWMRFSFLLMLIFISSFLFRDELFSVF